MSEITDPTAGVAETPVAEVPVPSSAEAEGVPAAPPVDRPQHTEVEGWRGYPELPYVGSRPPAYSPDPVRLPLPEGARTELVIPDIALDGARYGRLTVRGASVKGDLHRYRGEQRQDAMLLTQVGDGADELLFLAVADGVGSAAKSHLGAHRACRLASWAVGKWHAELSEALRTGDRAGLDQTVDKVVSLVNAQLFKHAGADDPGMYATTLRCLLVPTAPERRERVYFGVGDGGLFRARSGAWENLQEPWGSPGSDDVIDTGTAALPSESSKAVVQWLTTEPGDLLMICTDGLSNPMNEPRVQEFLLTHWAFGKVPGLTEFLWQAQVRAKSYDDDRSAVCVWEEQP
ncbi:protein phosphatase 2C domain-containing protein [Streptomyces sp. NPDC060020]|uniref:protein phosphatase 2C domain-containing protein n=1 Tax=Streptomyces sp. NPDC060020 TaxID=3347038 RepID=UPI0036A04073